MVDNVKVIKYETCSNRWDVRHNNAAVIKIENKIFDGVIHFGETENKVIHLKNCILKSCTLVWNSLHFDDIFELVEFEDVIVQSNLILDVTVSDLCHQSFDYEDISSRNVEGIAKYE